MGALNDWLTQTKTDMPELKDFITEMESFFSDTGFNASQHEKALETKLKEFQDEVKESLKTGDDVENKKNND
jgi:ElaB/YqjD/DUF883 family membrane-anchored ribosome-binding protein